MKKEVLNPERIRKITGSFAFIEHRFLRNGFWASLNRNELLLYVFLVLAADRNGLSYYGYDKICALLNMILDDYIDARNGLIDKDLIAFDGRLFQVLSLPERPRPNSTGRNDEPAGSRETNRSADIRQLIDKVGTRV